jgi:hypothetical protein
MHVLSFKTPKQANEVAHRHLLSLISSSGMNTDVTSGVIALES